MLILPGENILVYDAKQEVVKQWGSDPCGAGGGGGFPEGTKEFYESVDRNRYVEYAPWMQSVMGFDRFPGRRVLEVGFGMGTDLFQFAKNGSIVFGIDLTPRHLAIAKQRFETYGLSADLQLADAENIPFPDAHFDVAYTFGVIHHTPDTQKAIDEIYRVLKPGGQAIIAVYSKNSAFYWVQTVASNYLLHRGFLKESFRRTMARIEQHGEEVGACPLVKVYSRHRLKKMLRGFRTVKTVVRHLERSHFAELEPVVPEALRRALESRLGWYLVAKCLK